MKLFVPYTKAKRKRRDGEGSVSKRLSTSGEEALKGKSFDKTFLQVLCYNTFCN